MNIHAYYSYLKRKNFIYPTEYLKIKTLLLLSKLNLKQHNILKDKVRAMQNVRDYLRFKKFFHHRVQRVVQPRKTCFFCWPKKFIFCYPEFSVFWVFSRKTGFLGFFWTGPSWKQDRHRFWISATSSIDW
jgi:hypothetical protein